MKPLGNRGVCLSAASRPFLNKLSKVLRRHSIVVLGTAQTDDTAVRLCRSLYPDVLVTHQFLLSGSGFAAANALLGQTPSIVLCPRGEADYPVSDAIKTLYLPLNVSTLLENINEQGAYAKTLRMADHRLKLAEQRDAVARAKERLMEDMHMSEPQAHAYLQRLSMDGRIRLCEAAQAVLRRMGKHGADKKNR